MYKERRLLYMTSRIWVLFSLSLLGAWNPLNAQEDPTAEWRVLIHDLDRDLPQAESAARIAEWRSSAEALRSSLTAFAALHPTLRIDLPDPLPPMPSPDSMKAQLAVLTAAVDDVVRQSPGTAFNLGVTTVTVSAVLAPPPTVSDGLGQVEIVNRNLANVAQALDLLPGVSIQHLASNRNEAGIMVRGFSTRGQVPLYMDGVPIYVPYDGYVDLNRFVTSEVAEVQVSRGFSSPLLGPNGLGGSINLVTKEPVRRWEGEALMGTGSGDQLLASLRLGARRRRFFVQASLDWLERDYIPLSGDFTVVQYKNLPHVSMTDHLNQSDSRDERVGGRAGWTPRNGDAYVFSYSNQKGRKDVPLYQGPNTAAAFRNFWKWPYWNTDGYYFHSNTATGERSSLKLRAFYNQFRNSINMFSDDTYATMNTKSAEHSLYDEHTDGASAEWNTDLVPHNALGTSFFFKDDTHKEHGIYPGMSPFPLIQPSLLDRDQQSSIGFQDVIQAGSRWRFTGGFSADHLNGMQAQSYNTAQTGLVPFTCLASPGNTSFKGCTAHVWTFNPQFSAAYTVGQSGHLFVTFADRGRFPMLKDTYTASMGAGLPNPDLKPEHSRSWNAGYSQLLGARTLVRATLFRSDLRDAIESVYVTDTGSYCPNSKIAGFCTSMINIGSEVHQGLEFEVSSAPLSRLTLDASYSYLNRSLTYDFAGFGNVSRVNTSIMTLPTLPRNKLLGTATARLPRGILAMASLRYESGLTLQDTTYSATTAAGMPFAESYATVDLGISAPVWKGISAQSGVKNLLDRNYAYTAGYPEIGRNWYFNLRYRF